MGDAWGDRDFFNLFWETAHIQSIRIMGNNILSTIKSIWENKYKIRRKCYKYTASTGAHNTVPHPYLHNLHSLSPRQNITKLKHLMFNKTLTGCT